MRLELPAELLAFVDRELPEIGGAARVKFVLTPNLPFDWLPGDRQRYVGITLWRTVYLRNHGAPLELRLPAAVRLVLHELVHVAQVARLGNVGFPVVYLWGLLRHGYWDHPLEREAREREAELLQRYLATVKPG